jgi:site-specific DNA recombinase
MRADTVNTQDAGQIHRLAEIAKITRATWQSRDPASWEGQSAAVYCRISRVTDEDQTGVERQERICCDVAARLRLQVVSGAAHVDNNRSAWKRDRKRPGWDALLASIQSGAVSHVIAYHPDRMMRQPADLEELLRLADEHHVTLHGQAGGRDLSDPDDRFFLRLEVAHACRSSDDTSRRVRDGLTDRAASGKPHTGKRRFGYDASGTVIIQEEAEIIRWVFRQYLKGKTVYWLMTQLNRRGIATTHGKKWQHYTVRSLLDSHHVAGLRVYRGQEIGPGTWPAIIDQGMFREVAERRSYRAARTRTEQAERRSERFYLLRSLVWCTACGVRMGGGLCSGAPTYHCTCQRAGRTCGRSVAAATLEEFVSDAAIRMLTELDVTGHEAAAVLTEDDADTIAADEAKLTEAAQMWANGEITKPEYLTMRATIQARIKATQRKTIVRPAVEVLEGMTGPGAELAWRTLEKKGDYEHLNALLRFLFAAVRIKESRTRGRRFDFGRIDIEPNPAD